MSTTDATAWALPHAAASPLAASPTRSHEDPLGVLIEHLRAHPRVDAAVFLVVDPQAGQVEVAASWFASPLLEEGLEAVFDRPYDRSQPGLAEASLERVRPLFLPRLDAWESATVLRAQVEANVDPLRAGHAWEALQRASVIGCPVRTGLGQTMGVLIVASTDPMRALRRADLETVEVLADLAALARERSRLLAAETARAREELLLKRAAEGTAGSLQMGTVERQAVEHTLRLVEADHARLTRIGSRSSRPTSATSAGLEMSAIDVGLEPGSVAEVVRSRKTLHTRGAASAVHVPVQLGRRLFGVLSVLRLAGPGFDPREVELIEALARMSAAAAANALDFDRERRVARALTRGFVPPCPPELPGFEMGFLYEPAEKQTAGGDLYGSWSLPTGEVAVLVGDVVGKGVESAALSAMARFFIEARSWDCMDPSQALAQANTMLATRLPSDIFVTAAFGFLATDGCLRYANAGHLRPLVLHADGEVTEAPGGGVPLGVSETPAYEIYEICLEPGDVVLGFTDGLVEARRDGEQLGDERLRTIAKSAAERTGDVQELVRVVHHDVREWAGGLSDDVVMLGLSRRAE